MKTLGIFCIALVCLVMRAKADSLWIETDATGVPGKAQTIKVLFGSYNQYRLQKVGAEFQEVKDFTCWVVSPSGKKYYPVFTAKDTCFEASFTPDEKGVYVVLLENKQRKVEDWRNSSTKIGIAKQHYYGRTTIRVGEGTQMATDNQTDLSVIAEPSGREVRMSVLLHGQPVKDAVVFMRYPGLAEQKQTTDEAGRARFAASGSGRYFFLVTLKFESPGTYRGVHYDVFREKSTCTAIIQ